MSWPGRRGTYDESAAAGGSMAVASTDGHRPIGDGRISGGGSDPSSLASLLGVKFQGNAQGAACGPD
jgi:hypothetical protein